MTASEATSLQDRDVTVVEVGPRDGLQNESVAIDTARKIAFVNQLSTSGLSSIEVGSFVNPQAVPQMSDTDEVFGAISRVNNVRYSALVPNERGFERAMAAGVDSVAIFTSSTEAFCQANIHCSIDESFQRFAPVLKQAHEVGIWVRGYVSVAFDCPYSGAVDPDAAIQVAERLLETGCDEVSIADTLGTASEQAVESLLNHALTRLPIERTALHFHDTYGQAIRNIDLSFDSGIRTFDAAAGGLGGCPFAPGAAGNVATEQVVDYFESRGVRTGIDPDMIVSAFQLLGISRRAAGLNQMSDL